MAALFAAGSAAGQDSPTPVPRVSKDGPSLRFDFPEIKVGVAEYDEGPTGTTVFYFPAGVKGAVDVRGGAPGTVNAAALQNARDAKLVRAVVFSGGSWFGLSAATGVTNGIKELNAQKGDVDSVPCVVGAIIYDIGDRRFSRVTPDDRLGRAALQSAEPGWFPLGARGAGRFAMQGRYYLRGSGPDTSAGWAHSGQGAAFRTLGPTKVAVFTVVNSLGAIVDRNGRIVRCSRNGTGGDCPPIADRLKAFAPLGGSNESGAGPTGNTTLTLVVTNQRLPFSALQRLAIQVHGSMSRAIQPFATEADGDVLVAVTTDEVDNPALSPVDLGVLASEVAWYAVLSSVPEVPPSPVPLRVQPSADELRKYVGTYDLYGGSALTVAVEAGSLTITCASNGRIYFDKDRTYRLTAAEGGFFVVESSARDVVRFDASGGRTTGVTLNPGPWAVHAKLRPTTTGAP